MALQVAARGISLFSPGSEEALGDLRFRALMLIRQTAAFEEAHT